MKMPLLALLRRPVFRSGLVLALGVTVSALLWRSERHRIQAETTDRLGDLAFRLADDLNQRFGLVEQALRSLRGLYVTNGKFDRRSWDAFLTEFDHHVPNTLRGFTYLRRVPKESEGAFLAEMQAELGPDFHIRKQGDPPEMVVIVYRHMYEDEPSFIGVDRSQEAGWIALGNSMRRTGRLVLTPPLPYLGHPERLGLRLTLPLYALNRPLDTAEHRWQAHVGWISAVLSTSALFDELDSEIGRSVHLEVTDVDAAGGSLPVFSLTPAQRPSSSAPAYRRELLLFDRVWRLQLTALPEFERSPRSRWANQLFAGGLLVSGLMALLVWNSASTEKRALQLADEKTRDMQEREIVLQHAQRIANIGICVCDHQTGRIIRGVEYLHLAGISPDGSEVGSDDLFLAGVLEEDRRNTREWLGRFRKGEQNPPLTVRIRHPQRGVRILRMEQGRLDLDRPGPPRGIGILQDITERVAADLALAESHRRLEQLMRAVPGAVFELRQDAQGSFRFGFLTEGARIVIGDSSAALMADFNRLLALFEPSEVQRFRATLTESARTRQLWHWESSLQAAGSNPRWVQFSAAPSYAEEGQEIRWQGVVIDTTAGKLAEQALAESEKRLRLTQFAVDHVRDAVTFVSAEGDRVYVNDETCRLTGYTREELLRGKIWSVLRGFSLDEYRRLWESVKNTGTHTFESVVTTKSGDTRPVEISASFIGFGDREIAFTIARDISARKAAENALRASEERLRFTQFALDHAQDLVSIMDREGNRLYVNDTFCQFVGIGREELLQTKVWSVVQSMNLERFQAIWDDVKRGGTHNREIQLLTKAGELKSVELSSSYLNFGGKEAICSIARDLTPRKQAELEKTRMQQQLQETQKLESLGVLAGGIAHDFNNLLTGILGNANLARDRLEGDSDLHEPLRQIERASVRAAELCQQMLAYAGKGRIIVGDVELSRLVEDTAKLLDLSVRRRAKLDLRLKRNLPPVLADATQISQIIMNLVINAAEAINRPDGLIVVTTGCMQVDRAFLASARVAATLSEGEGVFLEVRDNGCGMDRETLHRIFEPFYTTKFTGRGLGLAAVLGIVRSHEGALHVQSTPGEGSVFRLVLPPSRGHVPAPNTGTAQPWRPRGKTSGHVLVVDDEDTILSVTRQALERIGFLVTTAADGEVALELLRRDPSAFHLVLLDYTMPKVDGAQLFREMRQLNVQAKAILMSGFSEQEARERFGDIAQELSGFIQKPFDIGGLRRCVDGVLNPTNS